MKPTEILLLLIALLGIIGCTEEYQPSSEEKQDITVIIAELEVGKDVNMIISSTYSDDGIAMFPTDNQGEARISNPDNGQLNKGLRSHEQRWFHTSFKFFEGQEIILETDFTELGLSQTYASAVVPPKGVVESKEETSEVIQDEIALYDLNINLSALPEENYYHIKPYLKVGNRKSFLKINEITEGNEASFTLSHIDGMLIDYMELENNGNLQFVVQSNDLSNTDPSFIYLMLKTVPKAYYDFHKSLTIQKETQQGPFDAPVPTFTNIEGGQGIFVAYQSALDSIPVR